MQQVPIFREFLSYWLPPLLGMTVILGLSGDLGSSANTLGLVEWLLSWIPSLGPAQIDMIHGLLRKGAHVLSYGLLYFFWFRAFQGHLGYGRAKAFLWALTLCLLVATMDEGHQSLLACRRGSVEDVALDMAGSSLAAVITPLLWGPPGQGPLSRGLRGKILLP